MRNSVVVDTSVALKWVLDEPDSNIAVQLLEEWNNRETLIMAPALLAYEITNALYQRMRRSDFSLERCKEALIGFTSVSIEFDFSQVFSLSSRTTELAKLYNLPATYDAHYLALAERQQCELWTADKRLWNSIRGKLPWVRWLADYRPCIL
ncbi:MAG TPA: type II toxin-antitoxin system VapC family toxin [Ktedonobacteraceae bacterium]